MLRTTTKPNQPQVTTVAALSSTLALLASSATFGDLVTNGSFETGDFSGWTVENAPVGSSVVVYNDSTPFGTHYASFAGSGGQYDSISQLLATTAGTEYTVTLWVNNLGIENDSLLIQWEGVTALNLTPLGTGLESWEMISFNVFATGNGSLLSIGGFDSQAAIGLDAISVAQVPAPGAAAILMATALRRSRRRAA